MAERKGGRGRGKEEEGAVSKGQNVQKVARKVLSKPFSHCRWHVPWPSLSITNTFIEMWPQGTAWVGLHALEKQQIGTKMIKLSYSCICPSWTNTESEASRFWHGQRCGRQGVLPPHRSCSATCTMDSTRVSIIRSVYISFGCLVRQ